MKLNNFLSKICKKECLHATLKHFKSLYQTTNLYKTHFIRLKIFNTVVKQVYNIENYKQFHTYFAYLGFSCYGQRFDLELYY